MFNENKIYVMNILFDNYKPSRLDSFRKKLLMTKHRIPDEGLKAKLISIIKLSFSVLAVGATCLDSWIVVGHNPHGHNPLGVMTLPIET